MAAWFYCGLGGGRWEVGLVAKISAHRGPEETRYLHTTEPVVMIAGEVQIRGRLCGEEEEDEGGGDLVVMCRCR